MLRMRISPGQTTHAHTCRGPDSLTQKEKTARSRGHHAPFRFLRSWELLLYIRGKGGTGLAQMLVRRSLFPQDLPINGLCSHDFFVLARAVSTMPSSTRSGNGRTSTTWPFLPRAPMPQIWSRAPATPPARGGVPWSPWTLPCVQRAVQRPRRSILRSRRFGRGDSRTRIGNGPSRVPDAPPCLQHGRKGCRGCGMYPHSRRRARCM
jgi:hypothetical protein